MGERGAALAAALAQLAEDIDRRVLETHLAVSGRTFRRLGPLAAPVRPLHDGLTTAVHGAVRAGLLGGGRLAAGVLRHLDASDALLERPGGVALVGAVVGLRGESLRSELAGPAWPTQLRDVAGHLLAEVTDDGGVRVHAEPGPGRPRVVLLHGLCETELSWWQLVPDTAAALPDLLDAAGAQVVLLRADSGRRIAHTGADVAALLDALAPSDAPTLLLGHSMGGLVARAALRAGSLAGHGWVDTTAHLVTLGTPHAGAPLEQAVELLVRLGERVPEVAALVRFLDLRADGVRDLRHGADHAEAPPGRRSPPTPLPEHVVLHTVAASLPGSVRPRLFGDGLVRPPSAHATAPDGSLRATRGVALDLAGRSHFDLLADPQVAALVTDLVVTAAGA